MIDCGTLSGMLHYAHLNACTKSDALVRKCTFSKKVDISHCTNMCRSFASNLLHKISMDILEGASYRNVTTPRTQQVDLASQLMVGGRCSERGGHTLTLSLSLARPSSSNTSSSSPSSSYSSESNGLSTNQINVHYHYRLHAMQSSVSWL